MRRRGEAGRRVLGDGGRVIGDCTNRVAAAGHVAAAGWSESQRLREPRGSMSLEFGGHEQRRIECALPQRQGLYLGKGFPAEVAEDVAGRHFQEKTAT